MRPIDETIEDIRQQAQFYQGMKINSCFLQDGDALVLKTDYLLRILDAINQYFPDIQYITFNAFAVWIAFSSDNSLPPIPSNINSDKIMSASFAMQPLPMPVRIVSLGKLQQS